MFEFTAKLLKNAYTFWGERLPQELTFEPHIIAKIEGRIPGKHHSNGDLPIQVVYDSLDGTLTICPPTNNADFHVLSIGKAVSGMLDDSPDNPKARPRVVGSDVYILTGVKIIGEELIALTSFPLRSVVKYNELKATEMSIRDWMALYESKLGTTWVLTEKEKNRMNKNSSTNSLEYGYNRVSEEAMKAVTATREELIAKFQAKGKTPEEITKILAELDQAYADQNCQ